MGLFLFYRVRGNFIFVFDKNIKKDFLRLTTMQPKVAVYFLVMKFFFCYIDFGISNLLNNFAG